LQVTTVERDEDSFDLDGDFVAEAEESQDYDKFIERRPRPTSGGNKDAKKGKAAWSKLEDVLAERRLQKELEDFDK
jgi:hypothetical protein